MADSDRGVAASKIEAKVDKLGTKAKEVFKKKPAVATSSNAPTTSPQQPPPAVGTGSGTPPASQPKPLAESTSKPPTRPSTPVGKQITSTGSQDSHSASTSSTTSKAAKIPIPGGRKTPEDRLRTAILVRILFMDINVTLTTGCQIGINYLKCDSKWKLKGCANDVVAMYQFCKSKSSFVR